MREYLLSLIAAALLISIVYAITDKKSSSFPIIKLICGLFITITALSPLTNINIPDISSYIGDTKFDANQLVDMGENATYESMAAIITENLESYILGVAEDMGTEIQVKIILDEEIPPSPCAVELSGNVSPYSKQRLREIIKTQLGISEDNQIWI